MELFLHGFLLGLAAWFLSAFLFGFASAFRNKKDVTINLCQTPKIRRAYVFGVNYGGYNESDDEGCWKDVALLADSLRNSSFFGANEVLKYVNDRLEGRHFTSATGFKKLLTKATKKDSLDLIYVHFCGSGHEDGILTSDGCVITNEWLVDWAMSFPDETKVVATFDCDNYITATLPRSDNKSVLFISLESVTHALVDMLDTSPHLLTSTPELISYMSGFVGACPRTTSTCHVSSMISER